VIVARYLPPTLPVQEIVDVPEPPAIELDDKLHTRLVELVVATSPTVPVNPFTGVTDIVAGPAVLTVVETEVGLAINVKSCTWYFTEVECESEPLVPVTVAR
jgi:hypothetical protein